MLKNKMKDTSNSLMIMKSTMNGEYDSYLYDRVNSDILDKDEIKESIEDAKNSFVVDKLNEIISDCAKFMSTEENN